MHKGCGWFISLLLVLGLNVSAFAAIYKWIDKDGKVHYSDTPRDGAQIVKPKPNTENSIRFSVPVVSEPEQQELATPLSSVQISSPIDQQTIRNNNGDFTVSAFVTPISTRLQYVLLLDGKAVSQPQKHGVFSLKNIDRGEHKLQVILVNGNKSPVIKSNEITVYVHRFSKLFKS